MRRRSDDRGAILVLSALLMVGITVMAAVVLDLGMARQKRHDDQQTVDSATVAAGGKLAAGDPRGGCEDAWRILVANIPALSSASAPPCSTLQTSVSCAASPWPTTVLATDGPYRIAIRYPVPASDLVDPRFGAAAGARDGQPCERMSVTLTRDNDDYFAPVSGNRAPDTVVRAVVRGQASGTRKRIPALLTLDRTGCGVIQTSGQGQLIVRSFDADNPGVISADSSGTAGCSGSSAGYYTLWATTTPSGGLPSIIAEPASAELPGVISLYASMVNPSNAWGASGGVSPTPTPGAISSRAIADKQYNAASSPSRTTAITNLRSDALSLVAMSDATALANGYTVISSCGGGSTAAKILLRCDLSPSGTSVFPNATDVVVTGKIDVGSNRQLRMPNVKRLVVGGGNGNGAGVKNQGILTLNDGSTTGTPTTSSCATRVAPGTTEATVVILGGNLVSNSNGAFLSMCETVVLMGFTSSPQQIATGGTCTTTIPCPDPSVVGGGSNGQFDIGGGGVTWTGPNQTGTGPSVTEPLDGLAYWTESNLQQSIGGNANNLKTEGVFFMPNAPFTFTGQGTQIIEQSAQFISRTLNLSGQGTLALKPNPDRSIPQYVYTGTLIR